jgi:hypothetical protein
MNFRFESPSLLRELADHDARQLLDIGLVRGDDGALRLAADPAQALTPATPARSAIGLIGSIRAFLREAPEIPLRTAMASH